MANNLSFIIQRIALVANQSYAVRAPQPSSRVNVVNVGIVAIDLYSIADDASSYITLEPTWEREFRAASIFFRPEFVACWLKCASNTTAVLIWN